MGSRGSGGMAPWKTFEIVLHKSLEIQQFHKRCTFRPSMKALRKAVFKDETSKCMRLMLNA